MAIWRSMMRNSTKRRTRRRQVAGDTCARAASAWFVSELSDCRSVSKRRSVASSTDILHSGGHLYAILLHSVRAMLKYFILRSISKASFGHRPLSSLAGEERTMCGIVGAVSQRNIVPVLIEGLRRL